MTWIPKGTPRPPPRSTPVVRDCSTTASIGVSACGRGGSRGGRRRPRRPRRRRSRRSGRGRRARTTTCARSPRGARPSRRAARAPTGRGRARVRAPRSARPRVVRPEARLEVDLAGVVAALVPVVRPPPRRLSRRHARRPDPIRPTRRLYGTRCRPSDHRLDFQDRTVGCIVPVDESLPAARSA